jgi:glycine C-acetyltransferase
MSEEVEADYLETTYDMFIASMEGPHGEALKFDAWVQALKTHGIYSFEAPRLEAQRPVLRAQRTDGTPLRLLNLSSFNYLGYAYHPEVIAAAKAALDTYGLGACSSPIQAGTLGVHAQLEAALLDFIDLPGRGVALFSAGYSVNTGSIAALMKRRQHIVMDRACHMSILEGAQLSRANLHYFEHNDPSDLERILKEIAPTGRRILVCTEGVFSADGDTAPLREIVSLAKQYGAQVLVDEAHSFGVAGPRGRGVAEAEGVLDQIDYLVVTFSKAFGGVGGALIARHEVAQYVRWYAKSRAFSTGLDPAVAGGVTRALQLAKTEDGQRRRDSVKRNAAFLLERLRGRVNTGSTGSWIVPVIFGPSKLSLPLCDWMQRKGQEASVMTFPAVPPNQGRLRLFVTSEHTEADLALAADNVLEAASLFGFRTDRETLAAE